MIFACRKRDLELFDLTEKIKMNINTSYTSTAFGANLNPNLNESKVPNKVQNTPPQNTNPLPTPNFPQTYASEFGFRIDERGIFDKELNKAANLPQSYDINVKSVQSIAKELTLQNADFNQSDIPQLLNKYFSTLRAVESEFSTQDNANLSRSEITQLHQGFSTKNGLFEDEIIRVYKNANELKQAQIDNKNLNPLGLDNKITNFSFNTSITNTADNEFIKPYLTKNGEVSKAGLLMNFVYEDLKAANSSNVLLVDALSLKFTSHQDFYKMLDDENSLKSFINESNKESMSFDFYLYVNGINKQTISDKKLLAFYQQYLNYEKSVNMQEFINSSSIYQLYTQILVGQFNSIKQDFSTQSDSQTLAVANEMRTKSLDFFSTERKRQADLNTIIKAYKSVMGEF